MDKILSHFFLSFLSLPKLVPAQAGAGIDCGRGRCSLRWNDGRSRDDGMEWIPAYTEITKVFDFMVWLCYL